MTPTDGTANIDAEGEQSEPAPPAIPQPKSSNSAELTHIAVDEIYVPADRRALQPDTVADLAQSMKILGLLSPVAVRWVRREVTLPNALTVKGAYHLIYGLHRLAAARQLGWNEIPCQILFSSTAAIENAHAPELQGSDRQAWMVEIAENLHRAELTALERSEHIAAWIKLIEEDAQGPGETEEISGGVDRRGSGRPKGGRSAAAREIGISEADARRSERIAALPDNAKVEAKTLGLDDNQVALLKATRAADPVSALRDHATFSKEAPLLSPPAPTATAPADEAEFASDERRARRGDGGSQEIVPRRPFGIRVVGAGHLSAAESRVGTSQQHRHSGTNIRLGLRSPEIAYDGLSDTASPGRSQFYSVPSYVALDAAASCRGCALIPA